ncbi:hypothetical protein [Streptomyces sp. NPDC047000]|uniref:hypothetical protein n=1 Tax=Streptomyces sp. NPDC047000 TaxID=3155474 RepID=UPI0033D8B851
MSDADTYTADPARVHASAQQIDRISAASQKLLLNFVSGVAVTRGWEGVDDTFAKSTRPIETRERTTTTETTRALGKAIMAIAKGTTDNAVNILTTQATNLDAIQQSVTADGGTSGRH